MRYADTPFQIPGSGPTDLYARLEHKLDGKPRKKVANNTYIIRHPDRLAVQFHLTDVVTAFPDGRVVIDSGGWRPGGGRWAPGWNNAPGTTKIGRASCRERV